MFLKSIIERNPQLVAAAVEFHQKGEIHANSWVVDLDTISENATILANAAKQYHLTTYVMSKQYGRNPIISKVAIKMGLYKAVAVDVQCVRLMKRYKVPIGHVGHLNQIPKNEIPFVLEGCPEVWTVFSVDQAKYISTAAQPIGLHQDLLIRIIGKNDLFFTGQEGGISEDELITRAREIQDLPNVNIVGVTSFPCISYNPKNDDPVEPTPNFLTIKKAADRLQNELGITISQINAPGNTSSHTFPMLSTNGATHVEPGHGLLGTTPNHAFLNGLPERPSYVYVSEISHHVGNEAYCFGGGFWSDIYDPDYVPRALVGYTPDEALSNMVLSVPKKVIIDYYGSVTPASKCPIGATVVFGFRTQMQMTRSSVVILKGIASGTPEIVGIFDHAGTMVDSKFNPIPVIEANSLISDIVASY